MKQFKKIGILLAFFVSFTVVNANPTDSIGTKVKNGKIFIMHKVEKAQGLFSISRRYNVPLNDIIEANPGSDKSLQVDQILLIPTGKDAPKEEQKVKEYFQSDKQPAATIGNDKMPLHVCWPLHAPSVHRASLNGDDGMVSS